MALTFPNFFIEEGTASTLKIVLSWVSNIGYLFLGFLPGIVASNNTIKSCDTLLTEAQRKNHAKKYIPNLRTFNALESIQWVIAAFIALALVAMTVSKYTYGSDLTFNLSQTLSNIFVMLSSTMRTMENGWLNYRQWQIKEIVDKDKKDKTERLTNENEQYKGELEQLTRKLNKAIQSLSLKEKFISRELDGLGKRIFNFKSFTKWIDKGLTLPQLQAIHNNDSCENIESKAISSLIANDKLTVIQGLALTITKRKLFETLYEKNWLDS